MSSSLLLFLPHKYLWRAASVVRFSLSRQDSRRAILFHRKIFPVQ